MGIHIVNGENNRRVIDARDFTVLHNYWSDIEKKYNVILSAGILNSNLSSVYLTRTSMPKYMGKGRPLKN